MDDERRDYLWKRVSQGGERDETWWLDHLEYVLGGPGLLLKRGELWEYELEVDAAGALHKPQTWPSWVEESRDDPRAWEVVRRLVESLRHNHPEALRVPPLWDWVLDAAVGPGKPKGSGGRREQYRLRDLEIVKTIYALRDLGHSVEEASRQVAGRIHSPNEEMIRKIWKRPEYKKYRERQLPPMDELRLSVSTLRPSIEQLKDRRRAWPWFMRPRGE